MVWAAPAARGPVTGRVTVPGSKSLTNRHLLLAALAAGPSTLHHPLVSRDTELMLGAVRALGVLADRSPDDRAWTLTPPERLQGDTDIDCGLAGTVLRFVPAVAALAGGPVRFDGDEQARSRPIGPLLESLAALGIVVDHGGRHTLPFTVRGRGEVTGGDVRVDASASSQFVSALLLAAPRFTQGLRVQHTGARLPSLPHIEMTVQTLRESGVTVHTPEPGTWVVEPGPIGIQDLEVEPDLSSAAPFLAAAAVTGGAVTVAGWPPQTTQAGDRMRQILTTLGCTTETSDAGLTLTGPPPGELRGADLDLHDVGELTPVVAAVAALAGSPTRLSGIAHLRGHETDRLAALETEIGRLGGVVEQTADGLTIQPTRLRPATLRTYEDHRMVMAAAVLALAVPGTEVLGATTVAKTFPQFAQVWTDLVQGSGDAATGGVGARS